jgi:hypothetical protein
MPVTLNSAGVAFLAGLTKPDIEKEQGRLTFVGHLRGPGWNAEPGHE